MKTEGVPMTSGTWLFIAALAAAYVVAFAGTELAIAIKGETYFLVGRLADVVWINEACKTALLLAFKLFYLLVLPFGIIAGIVTSARDR